MQTHHAERSSITDQAGDHPPNWIGPCQCPLLFDLPDLFGNRRPTELEIGCGKGLFLARESEARPAVNFIGVDWSQKYSRIAASRLCDRGNVRILYSDARVLLPKLNDSSLAAVHIYFPDPWWKRRHRERRTVAPDVLLALARVLQPRGLLHLATDVEEYFGVMLRVVNASNRFRRLEITGQPEPAHETEYRTHFERKYRIAGRSIFRASFARFV